MFIAGGACTGVVFTGFRLFYIGGGVTGDGGAGAEFALDERAGGADTLAVC